ncbi:SDR family oxidoreductase [Alteromonas sp. a30]|uniref:SDR family oxidoreductase n=1 Tax=Alteromonas sp. a30 TaxID=2730917 RepID=UPI00227F4EC8|nr:SDR family oxidoreductase [Alteromonas sp. a30]MCY7295584.1 SDR family oxidoreductase [Alteromonas sp. a30]
MKQTSSPTRVLITGGGSGLGKALAYRWADAGAKVCIADINTERGEATMTELKNSAADVLFCQCDITQQSHVEALRDTLMQEWGGVDVVVNNAGVATGGSIADEPMPQWQWVFEINLFGMVRMTQVFAPIFQQQGRGYFLNVASQAGLTPMPLMGSYCAVKSAVVSFSESMRLELVDDNIGVSVLCPAFFRTNLHESMRSDNPVMHGVVNKLLERGTLTAEQVAEMAFQGVQKGEFMIQTHKEGRRATRLRRWLPQSWYLRMMEKQTSKFREKGGRTKSVKKAVK